MSPLWQALIQSLRISLCATVGVTVVGVPVAYLLARHKFPGKGIVQSLLTLPLVLPPTVVGYFLLVLLGHNGVISHPLHFSILWTWYGAATAAGVVAFPLLLLPARAAFAGVDRELEDVARLAGASRLETFLYVSLPLAAPGIASGVLLTFARALGEFGATVMILGIQDRSNTLPLFVYEQFEELTPQGMIPAVLVLTGVTLVVIAIYNRLPANRV